MTSSRDLRDQMNSDAVADAFSFLVSGKRGYKTIIERKVEPLKCTGCNVLIGDNVKFCSECGTKVILPLKK
jgi:rRNA maturation endonuclease Nob1